MANALTPRQAVRVYLASHDKTQIWLAKKLGVSQSTVSLVLSGHTEPSDELADKLLKVTGVDIRASRKAAA